MLKTNEIYHGDCLDLLKQARGLPVQLVFADPPFNIGYAYDIYDDHKKYDDYCDWTKKWMRACREVLAANGSFYIAIGDDYAAEIRMFARELGLHLRNWVIWHYTFGQQTKMKFARAHTHIFYFVVDPKNFIFNDEEIRVPSARQLVYNDKRANSKGKIPDDVWRYSRVCGTFKEREGWHTCQMPTKLLARIIKTSSNPGDLVLDPFSGSGTTALTAAVLKRQYLAFDLSESYVQSGRQRIARTLEQNSVDIDSNEPIFILARDQSVKNKKNISKTAEINLMEEESSS
jgi:site-specific DNA-methyltransferase (adenine-specific)